MYGIVVGAAGSGLWGWSGRRVQRASAVTQARRREQRSSAPSSDSSHLARGYGPASVTIALWARARRGSRQLGWGT
jgi:hypothetical protein